MKEMHIIKFSGYILEEAIEKMNSYCSDTKSKLIGYEKKIKTNKIREGVIETIYIIVACLSFIPYE